MYTLCKLVGSVVYWGLLFSLLWICFDKDVESWAPGCVVGVIVGAYVSASYDTLIDELKPIGGYQKSESSANDKAAGMWRGVKRGVNVSRYVSLWFAPVFLSVCCLVVGAGLFALIGLSDGVNPALDFVPTYIDGSAWLIGMWLQCAIVLASGLTILHVIEALANRKNQTRDNCVVEGS